MNTPQRLAAFGVVIAAVFGVGIGAGAVFGPDATVDEQVAPAPVGEGVVSTVDGYRFVPGETSIAPDGGMFEFVIEGPDGAPVRDFTELHEQLLHLIVVNRELTVFHHLHPSLHADGSWSIELPPLAAGSYRAVADFEVSDGPRLALGVDLSVAGPYQPSVLGDPMSTSSVDGYDVTIATDAGDGGQVRVVMTVRKDGMPVTDLQPYLGAFGHLVAMRSGDLAYAHVHPVDAADGAGGVVAFDAELGAEGRYGFFFDFRHAGAVHTATFTFDQGAVSGAPSMEH